MWKLYHCILVCILAVAVVDKILCHDADSEILGHSRQKRQGRNRPRPPEEDRDRNFDGEEYRPKPQGPARNRQRAQPLALNLGNVLESVGLNLGGSQGSLLGGQADARPVHQGGSQPQGSEFNGGRPGPPPDRIPPGHQDRPGNRPPNKPPGRPDHKPAPPPGRPEQRPGHQNPRPEDPQGFQNPRPGSEVDEFGNPRPNERPPPQNSRPGNQNLRPVGEYEEFVNPRPTGQLNSRPGDSQGFQNPRPVDEDDRFENSRPAERPSSQNSRPGSSQGFQNSRPAVNDDDDDRFSDSRPTQRPASQNSRPGSSQGFQNSRPESNDDEFVISRPVERPVSQNSRPSTSQGFQNSRPAVDDDDRFSDSRPTQRPASQNSRPGNSQGFQNSRPAVDDDDRFSDSRPVERPASQNSRPGNSQGSQNGRPGGGNNGQQNSRPNNGQQGQQNSGNGGQQYNNPNGISNDNDRYNGGSTEPRPQPNRGEGSKKCRGNQYTCQNRECVPKNARCNGVNECRDGSDEINCYNEEDSYGQGSSFDRTTAAPFGQTTASSTEGCVVPEQPTGGRFELDSCKKPCTVSPGTRVPVGSFLTYRCNEGYSLKGNNVSFCHVDSWYLQPTCVRTCPPLKSNSVDIVCKHHGEIVSCETAIAPETTATLACKHSYKIPLADDPAYRELTCTEDGIWDRTLFRCLPECGTPVAHGNTLIVNGFTAKLGVFPWHVGIYQRDSDSSFVQICAGSLISPDLVISAAHCFYDDTVNQVMSASEYTVAAGKQYRSYDTYEKYAQKSAVKKIEVASRYYGASGNFAEDIALVRLKKPFTLTTLVRPICMDWDNRHEREQLQSGQVGKAVGWGKTAEGVPSEELQEVNLPFIPYQECVSAVPADFRGYVTADKFCAGYLNGTSLCEGDSGGGLGFQLESLWYLRGVVSVSPISHNSCDNNYYTAFTNVARFRDWIRAAYVTT